MAIRHARETDIPQILAIYGPYVTDTAYSFEYTVPTQAEFTARFRTITQQFPWLVWEEDGQVLGYVYGSAPFERAAYRWCSEASVYLRPDVRGRGIGRALYAALEQILTLQGYTKVYAIITQENRDSLAFHQAVGYTHTATMPACGYKFGRWYGIVWMEKTLKVVDSPSNFPVPADAVVKNNRNKQKISALLTLS